MSLQIQLVITVLTIMHIFLYLIREFSLLGLFIIGVGTGGIKPCVSAFGGEQFVRPQQDKQLEQFFSYFYISINAGSLLSTLLTPILREDVQCFGQNSCFPLAFGVPAILMIVAIGIQIYPHVMLTVSFFNIVFLFNCFTYSRLAITQKLFSFLVNGTTRCGPPKETSWSMFPNVLL